MSLAAHRADNFLGIHASTEDEPQHTSHLLVEYRHRHLTLVDESLEGLGQIIVVVAKLALTQLTVSKGSHLDVESAKDSLLGIGGTAPVADQRTVPSPLFLQNAIEQGIVMTAMHVLPQVVGTHDAPYLGTLHGLLEGIEVNLAESTLRYVDIDGEAVYLLIVEHEMFQTAAHPVLLGSHDIRHRHLASQIGVFTHILEGATIERCALDVDSRSQQ